MNSWFMPLILSFAGTFFAFLLLFLFARPIIKWVFGRTYKRLVTDRYPENLWEVISAFVHFNPIYIIENSLRAETGKIIERPFGSIRNFLNFDGLVFSPAQLAIMPADEQIQVDTKTVIGPMSQKPLQVDIPILLGAMGYGIGVTKKLRIAMAKGSAAVGTASNAGEGVLLLEERMNSKYLILQYSSAKWSKEPEVLRQGDAIEIHIGQGASAAAASRIPPEFLQGEARVKLGLQPGETALISSRHKELQQPHDLKPLVDKLREITGGVPIGIKMAASQRLEQDLLICIQAGVDFISIDGGQAGTKGAPPILEDDFALPTIYALSRAVRFLKQQQVKERISLIVGGGLYTPGDCLKALALGADAVYLGTAALWAMTHKQVTKTLPFEPPTHLVAYAGKMNKQFDEDQAAINLQNYLNAVMEEMKIAVLALGKTSVHQVNSDDLVALDETTSKVTGIPLAYSPYGKPAEHQTASFTPFRSIHEPLESSTFFDTLFKTMRNS